MAKAKARNSAYWLQPDSRVNPQLNRLANSVDPVQDPTRGVAAQLARLTAAANIVEAKCLS